MEEMRECFLDRTPTQPGWRGHHFPSETGALYSATLRLTADTRRFIKSSSLLQTTSQNSDPFVAGLPYVGVEKTLTHAVTLNCTSPCTTAALVFHSLVSV